MQRHPLPDLQAVHDPIQIFDQRTVNMLPDEYRIKQVIKAESQTIAGLAEQLELDPVQIEKTVSEYSADCGDEP
jgi:tricarballylate dehydrogenase